MYTKTNAIRYDNLMIESIGERIKKKEEAPPIYTPVQMRCDINVHINSTEQHHCRFDRRSYHERRPYVH